MRSGEDTYIAILVYFASNVIFFVPPMSHCIAKRVDFHSEGIIKCFSFQILSGYNKGVSVINLISKRLKKKKRFVVMFLGDSLVSQLSVFPNWRRMIEYVVTRKVKKVAKDNWWRLKFINFGASETTSRDLFDRLKNDVYFYKPDLVICMVGKNDPYFNIGPNQHKKNLNKIFSSLSQNVEKVFYCTPMCSSDEERNKLYKKYIKQGRSLFPYSKIKLIDLFKATQKLDLKRIYTYVLQRENKVVGLKPGEVDVLHPNPLGSAYIAKIILKEVFGVDFNPKLFLKGVEKGEKYPEY